MLNIITKNIDNKIIIEDVESRFKLLYSQNEIFDAELYLNIMKKIDRVIQKKGKIIETPFNYTTIENLSTGCKALLLILYYKDSENILVSIEECGNNAIEVLFSLCNYMDLNVYVSSYFSIYDENVVCKIDNDYVKGGFSIYERLLKEV